MNKYEYKTAVFNAFECGCSKLPLMKTQNILMERFGTDLNPPRGYKDKTIMEAYLEGYSK